MKSREQQIRGRREGIPRAYRQTYDRAVTGRSLRAAVNAFCLECVSWQVQEVRLCTDEACPLWAVRPYQVSLQNGQDGHSTGAGGPKGEGDGQ